VYKIASVKVYDLLQALLNRFSSTDECIHLIVNGETPLGGFHNNAIISFVFKKICIINITQNY
jgi:hypothetical protein